MASETIPADNLGDDSQAWRRWVEEGLKKQAKIGRNYGLHQRANDKQKDAFGRALREAGLSQAQLDAAVKDAKRKPAAPANAQTTTDAYFAADGTPQSRVSMSTDVVTVDVNGKSINVANYQLYGRRNVAGTPWRMLAERESPVLVFDPLPIGEEWQFKVHAVSAAGVVGEASAALVVTMARDTTPPGKPAPMTATSRLGQVILSWNGKVETGLANQPPDYSHSVVYVATSASAVGTAIGRIGTGGDTFYPPEVPYNQARWYFLVSYDKSGNASVPSNRVSIVTKPLVDTDIIGRVLNGANMKLDSIGEEALSGPVRAAIASGGGTMNYYQPNIPTGGSYSVGDTWFDSDDGYRISRWNGTTWVEAKLGAGAIESASITNALIADATIQSAKIANLDAGKITTGLLSADRIGANTITANKLLIGDFENYAIDMQNSVERGIYPASGNWSYASMGSAPGAPGAPWGMTLSAGTGFTTHNIGPDFAVTPGEQILISVWMHRGDATTSANVNLQIRDASGAIVTSDCNAFVASATVTANRWIKYEGFATIPANGASARPQLKRTSGNAMTGTWYFWKPEIRRSTTPELLVDGAVISRTIATDAVVARTIAANQIEAGHIKSNAITADKINAGAITAVKIDAEAVTTDKIAARAITVDKIVMGNFANLIADPKFVLPFGKAWYSAGGTVNIQVSTQGLSIRIAGAGATSIARNYTYFDVNPGEQYEVSGLASNQTDANAYLSIRWYRTDRSLISTMNITVPSSASGWNQYSSILTAPNDINLSTGQFQFYLNSSATTGNAYLTNPRVMKAVSAELIVNGSITGDKIDANAINGKTITGALIRSAASGARTELNSSGLQVLDSSGAAQVRLGYGISTGMQVRNPNGGALVPLGPHVFGTAGYTNTNNLNVTAGTAGNWGAYTDESLGPTTGVVSSPTGRMLVFAQVNLSYNSALDTEFQIVADLSSPSGSVRFIDNIPLYGGAMTHVAIVNVVAGRTYRPFFAIRGRSGTSGRVSTFTLRTMVAMPI